MRKIVSLALAGAALAAIGPALADRQLPAECLELDRLRATANSLHALADVFRARLRELEAEESKYFTRFDAEKTITLSGTVKEFQFRAPRAEIILNVDNSEAQPATWMIEMNSPSGLIRLGWTSKTLAPGMPIKLTIRPLRDGSNGGQFMIATLPDGRQMDSGRPATAVDAAEFLQTRLQSLTDQAADADRHVADFLQGFGCGR
jgi:Family of unknown function (DUF6152)